MSGTSRGAGMVASMLAAAVGLAGLLAPAPAYAVGDGEPYDATMCRSWASEPAGSSWAIDRLRPDRAWSRTRGEGVTIAVLDTGVDVVDVPMLDGADVTTINFAGFDHREDNEGLDDCAHGTAVVSLIVGQPGTDPNNNLSGIAPGAEVIAMRTLQVSGADPESEERPEPEPLEPTINAIHEAIDRDVDIINISQQGTDTPEYRAAIEEALANDIVVIAAAGNRGADPDLPYPAAYPGVIAVGMSNQQDLPHELSQWHPDLRVTVSAPGAEVFVARPSQSDTGAAYASESGTSFAAPQVTGAVALMLSEDPDLTPAEVRTRLELTADPPPMAVPDKQLGYGIVNPVRAVTGVVPREPGEPGPSASGTPAPDLTVRPGPDTAVRNIALAVGGLGVIGMSTAVMLALAAPAGRRRRWRPARPDDG